MTKRVKRLYNQLVPEHYELHLVPDRDTMKFSGIVKIRAHRKGRPSQRITLHQKGLKIISATVSRHDKKGDHHHQIARIHHHKSADEVRLHTEGQLYAGMYTISLEFEGPITAAMNGIYPCNFEHKSQKKQIIATQFESHHAREVFPCIDEPEAKATFDLTLSTPAGETVLANTPIKNQKKIHGQVITQFERTPKMSTYLLAFAYGDMTFKEAETKDGIKIRTYATPGNVEHTEFALDFAVKCLEFYNDYFEIPYPLEKCDMIALPDFASGAMENWGLITYREQALLVDPKNTSLHSRQYVAMVVAHELAHQWFGNLVTMRWWTDLWLNEGFASWIEYLAVDHIFPEWELWTHFIVDEQQSALKLDALENTHPVEVPVHHPDEIRTIFDTISYHKGASVIHMLHEYLQPEVFREGLRYYLKAHAYGNTDTVDLWAALTKVSGKSVKDFMHPWTSESGYPIVHVNAKETSGEIGLKQERFYLNPKQRTQQSESTCWPVPILGKATLPDLLHSPTLNVQGVNIENVKINQGHSGFYRVAYDNRLLTLISMRIADNQLSAVDRLGVLSDAFEAAKAGYSGTIEALELMKAFKDEANPAVWDVISGNLSTLRAVMDDEILREAMKPYSRQLVARQLNRLGWDKKPSDTHYDTILRPTILSMAAFGEDQGVIKEALKRFDDMENPEDVDPDIRSIIYGVAVKERNDPVTFDRLLQMHNNTSSSDERLNLCAALTGFKDDKLYRQAIDLADSPHVRHQDTAYWIAYTFSNRFAKEYAWKWLMTHWDWLQKNFSSDLSFSRYPIYAARAFSDESFLKEYDLFFKAVMSPSIERAYLQGREITEWQAAWKNRDLENLKRYFQN